jgi:hypothetical protein
MSRRLLWASVVVGSALSLAGAYAVATQWLVIGSREGGWVYGYLNSFNTRLAESFLIASVFLAAALAASWPRLQRLGSNALDGRTSVGEWTLILAWCLLAVALQGLIRSLTPYAFGTIFANDAANSFYSVALKYDTRAILGDFDRLRPSWALHAQSNLPGKLLLVRALIHLSTRADVLAWLTVLLSNLGGVLLYFFVRDLFADRFIAALSVILYLFMPSKLFFFPLLNTVTPVVVLGCGCLLVRWLNRSRTIDAALTGASLYGLVLFEPSALIVGVLFAALIVRAIGTGRIAPRTAVVQGAAGILAFAATYLAMVVWFGFDLISAFRHVAADAAGFNVIARRSYAVWVRQNLLDFLFGIGLSQVVLFWAALGDGVLTVKSRGRSSQAIVILCVAILAMVGAADAIGVNRGEVIRLWIFLACFCQIPAAYVCSRLNSRAAFTLVLITTLLQDALGSSMVGFIVPG